MIPPPGLFVVGTDTGVGKTWVAATIAAAWAGAGHRVGVLKPVATGAEVGPDGSRRWGDLDALAAAVGGGVPVDLVGPIRFDEPLAPAVAARRAGRPLEPAGLIAGVAGSIADWSTRADRMVVEGVGGLLCPLAEGWTVADLAIWLDYPLVVVARRGLGTLNHTLLTVEAAATRGLRVAGVILNGSTPTVDPLAEATNPAELARRLGPVPILADWAYDPDGPSPATLAEAAGWLDRSAPPRHARPEFAAAARAALPDRSVS